MKYIVTINGKKYEADVERADAAISAVPGVKPKIPAQEATVEKNFVDTTEGEAVKSPMPGTILSVAVKEGQKVKTGDVLCILEAMKMENEIMAGKDSTVVKIAVSKGSAVNTGDLLVALQ